MEVGIVGHVCRDLVDGHFVGGSGVFYGGAALQALNQKVSVFTKCNSQDEHLFESFRIHPMTTLFENLDPTSETTTFENTYPDGHPDHRVQMVRAQSSSFTEEDVKRIGSHKFQAIIVTPLIGEFPESLIPKLVQVANAPIVLDVQGFTRKLQENGSVSQGDWEKKTNFLSSIDVLKIDEKEGSLLTGNEKLSESSKLLIQAGVKCVVGTCADGLLVSRQQGWPEQIGSHESIDSSWAAWGRPKTPECRTGRGDTTLFSFVKFFLVDKLPFQEAVQKVATIVNEKMQHIGILTPAMIDAINKR